jgi:twitching motility protein PilJ
MAGSFSNILTNISHAFDSFKSRLRPTASIIKPGDALKASNRQLYIQMVIFLLFAVISFWVINQVRLDGPIFKTLNAFDDLTADVSTPTLYPVDAFAAYNQAFVAGASMKYGKRDEALASAMQSHQAFKARSAYWRANISNPALEEKLEESIVTGENFFFVANKTFKPALLKGAALATEPLLTLTDEFETTKVAGEAFLAAVKQENKALIETKQNFVKKVLLGLLLLGLWLLVFMYYSGTKRAARNVELTNQLEKETHENQEAVKLLLYEMGDLADGDLTVKAQVRDSITGAIADSINYTIDSLRDLVVEINRATDQVTSATTIAEGTSAQQLAAAKTQSEEIAQATETVTTMTGSILKVSSNAETAANVAEKSLMTARQGTIAVQNTIAGMNDIRTQIQETSKRMKRLGESSQEISEIVELISDITEQTNILSLNAAIQAASAGEAGRGFTVVAEEVQRLAERSSEATTQISAIVRAIQTDTNGAVAAMEKSTEGVVEGARVADNAGKALAEIETVTNHLAVLIHDISEATQAQTNSATTVSKNMQLIQDITTETTTTTQSSAASVEQLTALAKELRYSVAGFKL